MRLFGKLLSAFAIAGVGMTATGGNAQAQFLNGKTYAQYQLDAEEACRKALEEDTIEALEAYLTEFRFANTACRALALNALRGVGDNSPFVPGYGG